MGESTKAVAALLMMLGIIATAISWTADRPDLTTWGFRVGGPILTLLMIGGILKLHFRPDTYPDYLRQTTGDYFNRDGFCFMFVVTAIDGIAYLDAYFQSQYDQPSVGKIALRPGQNFLLTRNKIDTIVFQVECPPGGFGFVRLPIALPSNVQGKKQRFDVGAAVSYPNGKGQRIRFYDGTFLRTNTEFRDGIGVALAVAYTATGGFALAKPASAKIQLPAKVAEELSGEHLPSIQILWELGMPLPSLEGS